MARLAVGGMTVDAVHARKLCERRKLLPRAPRPAGPPTAVSKGGHHNLHLGSSFEEMLFRAMPRGRTTAFTAEVTISRTTIDGRPHILQRLLLPLDAAPALPQTDTPCPWSARCVLPVAPIALSRRSTIQVLIRDERGLAGKLFLLRLDLSDMPSNSQTVLRQKHYYDNSLAPRPILQHGLQVSVRRVTEAGAPQATLDGNGVLRMQPSRAIDRTLLAGMRVVFSFNQAAAVGYDAKRDASVMRESLRILTEYPLPGKYVVFDNASRASQHGAIL